MSLLLIFALVLAGVGVYMSYRDPKLGAAILVGLAIITVLYLIWEKDPPVFETDRPSPSAPTYVLLADPGGISGHVPTGSSPMPSPSSPPS